MKSRLMNRMDCPSDTVTDSGEKAKLFTVTVISPPGAAVGAGTVALPPVQPEISSTLANVRDQAGM
jgi:hypothetical protein